MKNVDMKKVAKIIAPIVIAVVSIFILSKYAASPEFHSKTLESLDNKKTTVMELTVASTATSAAITLIPGDVATPIADKLADLSSYFLIVLSAIYLEKYLVTITGYAAFKFLIPVACILYLVYVLMKKENCKYLAKKLAIFGVTIILVIPTSVQVSNLIETTYQSSINQTIDTAKQTVDTIEEQTEDADGAEEEEDESWMSGLTSKVKDGESKVTNSISTATAEVENSLNNFIEALAVMIVTSCVIPILVLVFFVWLIKIVLGVDVNLPKKI